MPLFLRMIKGSRWYPPEDTFWLADGEIQAEPLADLATRENTLSVFQISDNESNLERVIAAMAAQRDDLRHFEYALFDQQIIADLNIKVQKAPGDTKDGIVNEWHYDLTELSAQKLFP